MIIGVDPGITGAVAVIHPPADHLDLEVELYDMPVSVKTSGKGNQVSCHGLVGLIDLLNPDLIDCAFIERVNAMPPKTVNGKQRSPGATSMFGFGRSAGLIEMLFAASGIRYEFVLPAHWKKHFGLTGKDKDVARTLALERYPKVADGLVRKKDIGRADALLIADYGYQKLKGGN